MGWVGKDLKLHSLHALVRSPCPWNSLGQEKQVRVNFVLAQAEVPWRRSGMCGLSQITLGMKFPSYGKLQKEFLKAPVTRKTLRNNQWVLRIPGKEKSWVGNGWPAPPAVYPQVQEELLTYTNCRGAKLGVKCPTAPLNTAAHGGDFHTSAPAASKCSQPKIGLARGWISLNISLSLGVFPVSSPQWVAGWSVCWVGVCPWVALSWKGRGCPGRVQSWVLG